MNDKNSPLVDKSIKHHRPSVLAPPLRLNSSDPIEIHELLLLLLLHKQSRHCSSLAFLTQLSRSGPPVGRSVNGISSVCHTTIKTTAKTAKSCPQVSLLYVRQRSDLIHSSLTPHQLTMVCMKQVETVGEESTINELSVFNPSKSLIDLIQTGRLTRLILHHCTDASCAEG